MLFIVLTTISFLLVVFLIGISIQLIRIESILSKINLVVQDRVSKMLDTIKN